MHSDFDSLYSSFNKTLNLNVLKTQIHRFAAELNIKIRFSADHRWRFCLWIFRFSVCPVITLICGMT